MYHKIVCGLSRDIFCFVENRFFIVGFGVSKIIKPRNYANNAVFSDKLVRCVQLLTPSGVKKKKSLKLEAMATDQCDRCSAFF